MQNLWSSLYHVRIAQSVQRLHDIQKYSHTRKCVTSRPILVCEYFWIWPLAEAEKLARFYRFLCFLGTRGQMVVWFVLTIGWFLHFEWFLFLLVWKASVNVGVYIKAVKTMPFALAGLRAQKAGRYAHYQLRQAFWAWNAASDVIAYPGLMFPRVMASIFSNEPSSSKRVG